jgi:hypothetical protein
MAEPADRDAGTLPRPLFRPARMFYERSMKGTRPTTWFARLRRDRALFALVAMLLLAFNSAVPASHLQAQAAGVICALEGPSPGEGPAATGPECPVCLISASCLGGLAVPGPQTSLAAHPPRPGERLSPPEWADLLAQHERHRLGPIRAPPAA